MTGVHRVLGEPDQLAQAVADTGWRAAVVAPSGSLTDFYARLAEALDLPDWFGRNLDALWDVLTDLDGPTALVLADWTRLARADPRGWARLLALFDERAAVDPPFVVLLA